MTGLRYPGAYVSSHADRPAVTMASSGESMTYAELDTYAWRAARAFRALGLEPGAHVSIVMENRLECPAIHWGAHYAGLRYTFISTRLTPAETAYIVADSGAEVVLVTESTADGNVDAVRALNYAPLVFSLGAAITGVDRFEDVMAAQPPDPIDAAVEGIEMLYSSGTTGIPKGVKPPLSGLPLGSSLLIADMSAMILPLDAASVYLSPAPYYHAAPANWVRATTGMGGTAVLLEKFDAETALKAIEQYRVTHSQWVPTMFSRLLALPENTRSSYDLSSHHAAIHAAAPCPLSVKRAMIDWWGPILHEYYSGTEAIGMTHATSADWLTHPGTVGKAVFGTLRIVDENGKDLPAGEAGDVYFAGGRPFEYHDDPEKTAAATLPDGAATMGDIGWVDHDGFLFLTDRKAHMIISGGVNIYPQEAENLLQAHPAVLDAAVIGTPHVDLGEQVTAVVQLNAGTQPSAELASELIAYCREHISAIKSPRIVEFRDELPREPTGKLLKRKLREEFWVGRDSQLV